MVLFFCGKELNWAVACTHAPDERDGEAGDVSKQLEIDWVEAFLADHFVGGCHCDHAEDEDVGAQDG